MRNSLLKFVKAFLDIPFTKYGTPFVRTHYHSSLTKEKIVDISIIAKNYP